MITERQQKLLERIIREYVHTAQPISSKSLEAEGFLGVSSATIRSEMSELERAGYLEQPYTSAGRVPTDSAYRFYVDKIVKQDSKEVTPKDHKRISDTINNSVPDPREINKSVAQVLSELSSQLVITSIVEGNDYYKVGLKSLFELPEFQELGRAFRMTSFFEEFDSFFHNVARELWQANEIHVFIGSENPFRGISEESIICTEYRLPNGLTGSLTMIGPTRMNYRKNIGLVRCAADELNDIYG